MKTISARAEAAIKKEQEKRERIIRARTLSDSGYSNAEIAKVIGISESTVRNYLKEKEE